MIPCTEKQTEIMDLCSSKDCEVISGLRIEIREQTSISGIAAGISKKEVVFRQTA